MKNSFKMMMAGLVAAAPAAAMAHVTGGGHEHAIGTGAAWASGFVHPFTGIDHLLAMIAVGLWAAAAAPRERAMVVGAFGASMVAGAGIGAAGVGLPGAELVIALSVIVLGGLVAAQRGWQLALGIGLSAFFAFFHGFAHGAEMGGAAALPYFVGFTMASAFLVAGSAWATGLLRSDWRPALVRPAGAVIAALGVVILAGTL